MVLIVFVFPLWSQESQTNPDSLPPTKSYFAILSGGVGYGINIDNAVSNYPETKFLPGFSTFLSLRLGRVLDKRARLCLELSYFHKSMILQEANEEYGSVDLSWFLATPGVQWRPAKSSPIFFLAIVGFGYGTHRFTASRSWPFLDVQINDKWVFMLLPFKVDWLLNNNIAIGASFSGGSSVIAKTRWKIYGIDVPDIEEFLFSPAQIQIHASLLF
jgi:hypothetical protein